MQDNPHIALCPPGIHGEIRLLAENGQSGEDVEETMVCFKKWTNHVLQVSGKSLRYVYSCVKAQKEGWLQNEFQIGSTGRRGSHGQAFPKMPCRVLCLTHRLNHGFCAQAVKLFVVAVSRC